MHVMKMITKAFTPRISTKYAPTFQRTSKNTQTRHNWKNSFLLFSFNSLLVSANGRSASHQTKYYAVHTLLKVTNPSVWSSMAKGRSW